MNLSARPLTQSMARSGCWHSPRLSVLLVVLAVLLAPGPVAHAQDPPEAAAYVALPKALYVWRLQEDNRYIQRLAAFCKRHGFNRVFLAIGSCQWDHANHYANGRLPNEPRLAAAISALAAAGAEVHGMYVLNDDPDDLSAPERIRDLVTATHGYNQRHPHAPITGLHGDQEPSAPAAYAGYMQMNRMAAAQRDKLGAKLALGVTLKPLWLRQSWDGENGDDSRPFFHHILDVVDEASLMDYSDNPATVLRLGHQALEHAARLGKPMAIAVETGTKGAAPEETWAQEIEADGPLAFFGRLTGFAAAFKRHGKAWGGLVVHDYFQYYRLLYGTDPIKHEVIPGTLFGSSPADAVKQDAAAPECLRGFVGKVKLRVERVPDDNGAVWVVAVVDSVRREARESTASKARDAVGAYIALHPGIGGGDGEAGEGGLHARWLRTLAVGQSESVDITVDADGRCVVAGLSSSQRRAAERAGRND